MNEEWYNNSAIVFIVWVLTLIFVGAAGYHLGKYTGKMDAEIQQCKNRIKELEQIAEDLRNDE